MRGTARKYEVPSVSPREAFAALDDIRCDTAGNITPRPTTVERRLSERDRRTGTTHAVSIPTADVVALLADVVNLEGIADALDTSGWPVAIDRLEYVAAHLRALIERANTSGDKVICIARQVVR